jgi:hypothetical protein
VDVGVTDPAHGLAGLERHAHRIESDDPTHRIGLNVDLDGPARRRDSRPDGSPCRSGRGPGCAHRARPARDTRSIILTPSL